MCESNLMVWPGQLQYNNWTLGQHNLKLLNTYNLKF